MKNLSTLSAAVIASTAAMSATIANAADTAVDETMIVTASRIETPQSQVMAPVSVVTADDIDRLQISHMGDLLSRMTSVESVSSGGPGTTTGIFVRGGNTNHTLVLVDGVRINSATNGNTAIEMIDVSNIERVELVRGASSSLYGSDAISGVINIITKKEQQSPLKIQAEYGSQEWSRVQARLAGSSEATRWNLSLGHETLDGFDRREDNAFGNDDDDNYRNTHVAANVTHNWTDTLTSSLSYQLDKGESEGDDVRCSNSSGVCLPYQISRVEVLNLLTDWQVTDKFLLKGQIAQSVDLSESSDDGATPQELVNLESSFKTTRDTYLVQGNYSFNEALTLVVGSEYYNDRVKSSGDLSQSSRENMAFFGEAQVTLGKHQFLLGIRNDDNEAFGSHNTESISWGYQLTESTRVIASWGTAFHAPTFNDLYWPADPYGIGNPDLTPEESENMELAVKWNRGAHSLSGAVFKNRIDGLIDWAPVDPNNYYGQWTPSNLDDVRIKGFELSYGYQLGALSANANYTWIDADDLATDDRLANRARRIFNVDVDYRVGALTVGTRIKARSDRMTNSSAEPQLPGYGLVDVRASYTFSDDLILDATLTNALDKEYQERLGFNEEGRGFKVGITYNM